MEKATFWLLKAKQKGNLLLKQKKYQQRETESSFFFLATRWHCQRAATQRVDQSQRRRGDGLEFAAADRESAPYTSDNLPGLDWVQSRRRVGRTESARICSTELSQLKLPTKTHTRCRYFRVFNLNQLRKLLPPPPYSKPWYISQISRAALLKYVPCFVKQSLCRGNVSMMRFAFATILTIRIIYYIYYTHNTDMEYMDYYWIKGGTYVRLL